MNKEIIASQPELVRHVRTRLEQSTLPVFRIAKGRASEPFDLLVTTTTSGPKHAFAVACKLRPTIKDVALLAPGGKPPPLLATVTLTASLVEACKRQGVSCLDLNGRAWIAAKGLVIDRDLPTRNTRYVLPESPINFFSLKSARVARTLLSFPTRTWKQSELVDLTRLSKGLVSRLLKYASEQGWVEGKRGGWRLANFDALLDTWEGKDSFSRRVVLKQYSTLEPDRRTVARLLTDRLHGELAFTQWFAASLRFPYADVPIVSVYRPQFLTDEEQRALKCREVSDGGKIWILIPRDDGVFGNLQRVEDLPLVSDAQIYLDLIHAGLRGPDQAKALREWKGFCRS